MTLRNLFCVLIGTLALDAAAARGIDCRLVDCAPPPACCQPGFELRIPEGQCCQQCLPIDCSRVSCPLIRCAPNFESQIPEGECCAECVPTPPPPNPFVDECALSPDPGPCRASLQRFFFNDTAQTCQKFVYGGCLGNDNRFCSLNDCLKACSRVTPTEPVPDCSAVTCLRPVCRDGFVLSTPEGECCPQCVPDCSAVTCLRPVCRDGFVLSTPEGECCPQCVPDCSAVTCFRPLCRDGFALRTPEGECCPQCVPINCPIKGQEFQQCQSCRQTCAQFASGELVACPLVCIPGCGCPRGQYIDEENGKCVEVEDCPQPDICSLPSDTGSCRAFFLRYFFNPSSGECETFVFGGCDGNKNNFRTEKECERTCKLPTEPPTLDCRLVDCAPSPACCQPGFELRIPEGQCCQQCLPIDCSRVSCPLIRCAPNFESQIPEGECCAECVPTPPPPNPFVDECALSPDPGPCRASLQRFFFNDTAQTCQKFVYGGCLGNDNRFCSLSDCLEACASVTPTEPDCSATICPVPLCIGGFEPRVPEGECCQKCLPIDCKLVLCPPPPTCRPGFESRVPEGECCAKCLPITPRPMNCTGILCDIPICEKGFEPRTLPGQCCPGCQPILNCTGILCAIPLCEKGFEPRTLPGQCCPTCQPIVPPPVNCTGVLCRIPLCPQDSLRVVPEGECCAVCVPPIPIDCTRIDCLDIKCVEGFRPVVPDGQCCSTCQPTPTNCSEVQCPQPSCDNPVTLPGQCCPECLFTIEPPEILCPCDPPPCANATCPSHPNATCIPDNCRGCSASFIDPDGNEVTECAVNPCPIEGSSFTECATVCPPTCDNLFIICLALCQPGCACPPSQVIDTDSNRCVEIEDCPQTEDCPIEGQVHQRCQSCPETCDQRATGEVIFCILVCRPGCGCPPGQVIDVENNRCVVEEDCPVTPNVTIEFDPVDYRVQEDAGNVMLNIRKRGRNAELVSVALATVDVIAEAGSDYKATRLLVSFKPGGFAQEVVSITILDDSTAEGKEDFRAELSVSQGQTGVVLGEASIAVIEVVDDDVDICMLPPETGVCEAFSIFFFFNATLGKCGTFIYGGCGGNDNRFSTVEACERRCGDSCANFSCPAGSVCRTFEGEPFCDPSCDLQNGGCPEYTVCRLQTVFCIRAPCPPQVVCDPVITETPPTCQPPQEVSRCPIPSCLGPTCTPLLPSSIYRCCSPGHRCAVFQPTRETFCDPSCDLDNGGCPEGTVCRLNQVQCVRAPCPPVIECVNTSGCRLAGQEFVGCQRCQRTCEQVAAGERIFCILVCTPGCSCPVGQVIDEANNRCVEEADCPVTPTVSVQFSPVEYRVKESVGSVTLVLEKTGISTRNVTVFLSTVDVAATAGLDYEATRLRVTFPSGGPFRSRLTVSIDITDDRLRESKEDFRAELAIPRGQTGVVLGEDSVATVVIEDNDLDPCATVRCRNGHRCEVFEATGEAFCDPSCDINNGACPEGTVCRLRTVFCIRAPCPPVIDCVDPEDICVLPPEPGPCEAFIPSFFFNATSGRCERFVYGGCRGNDNRFSTLKECESTCDTCSLPADPGPCRAAFPAFFFNSTSQRCERFTYGGCRGNANRFSSLPSCVRCCSEGCPNKREVFQDCVRCPGTRLTCDNTGDIIACPAICQPGCDCPFPQVLDEEAGACVNPEECPAPCPPTCSPEVCRNNGRGLCSLPRNSRGFGSCGDRCQVTFCRACYYAEETRESPDCGTCVGPKVVQNDRCFRRWSICAQRASRNFARLSRRLRTEENYRCYPPSCTIE